MASYPGRVSVSYRIRIGLVLAASGVLLSACGGSSKSTSAGAAATASASTPRIADRSSHLEGRDLVGLGSRQFEPRGRLVLRQDQAGDRQREQRLRRPDQRPPG